MLVPQAVSEELKETETKTELRFIYKIINNMLFKANTKIKATVGCKLSLQFNIDQYKCLNSSRRANFYENFIFYLISCFYPQCFRLRSAGANVFH